MLLKDYYFPVIETTVHREDRTNLSDYKLIVREDTNAPISIVSKDYKLVTNGHLIDSLTEVIDKVGIKYEFYLSDKHNYVDDNRMKLMLLFPELKIQDDADGIGTCLYIHNSYDMSERIRVIFGMLRWACANGALIWGENAVKNHHKHTKGFDVETVKKSVESIYSKIPVINERIKILQELENPILIQNNIKYVQENVSKVMGDNAAEYKFANMWDLYNFYTAYITHQLAVRQHFTYQKQISNLFKL